MTEHITASPLTWPQGWPRTKIRKASQFGRNGKALTINRGIQFVLEQLRMMNVPGRNVIVSTDLKLRNDNLPYSNQRRPDDSGVAVWWKKHGEQRVIALDKYTKIEDNLHAIGKTLEAMRGIERWGGGEILNRTFTGFTALPGPDQVSQPLWRVVLDYYGTSKAEARDKYRQARKVAHPDHGGTDEQFHAVEQAWLAAQEELN